MLKKSHKPTILLVAGHSGCGKTTISKFLIKNYLKNFFFLDKDSLFVGMSGEMMEVVTGNKNDRDSPQYALHCREHEYNGLLECAIENAQLGNNSLICAPFGKEFKDKVLFDTMVQSISTHADFKAVWIDTTEEIAKSNIQKRAHIFDEYKLKNWGEYAKRRQSPTKEIYSKVLFVENNLSNIEDMSQAVIKYLAKGD